MDSKHGMVPVQVGVFAASQGKAQNINIQDLIGNQYTVNNHNTTNALFGIGYFINAYNQALFQVAYGINGFYFGKTSVSGTIVQEHLFTNLSYNYGVNHLPIYFASKATIKNSNEKYNFTLDGGIGPNIMQIKHYGEGSLNSFSVPDNSFASHNDVVFSAMAGIGLRLNKIFGEAPLECGYRFFYLGQGNLRINNNQVINELKTGTAYANAFLCSVTA